MPQIHNGIRQDIYLQKKQQQSKAQEEQMQADLPHLFQVTEYSKKITLFYSTFD